MPDAAHHSLPDPLEPFVLDDRWRGMPPGETVAVADIGARDWHPADGHMSLPLLTLDETAFLANRDLFMRYVGEQGAFVAPHAKTPMVPELARALVDAGAWGATVADIRQASVMARAGIRRLILANEVGGTGGARRLAAMATGLPDARVHVFADSVATVEALAAEWSRHPGLEPLPVFVEVGAGRAGARSTDVAEAVADAIQRAGGRLEIAGVATYEAAAGLDLDIGTVIDRVADMFLRLRARVGSGRHLMITAGGSAQFDRVVGRLMPVVKADGDATLILRSGVIFFHDNGLYDTHLTKLDRREGFVVGGEAVRSAEAFRPALRVWAEVLSRPEKDLMLCGMGMRDVSFDGGLPSALRIHRAGRAETVPEGVATVVRLNDQHAFVALEGDPDYRVGDVVEFGVSHPCTTFDRHGVIYVLGPTGRVRLAYRTWFG